MFSKYEILIIIVIVVVFFLIPKVASFFERKKAPSLLQNHDVEEKTEFCVDDVKDIITELSKLTHVVREVTDEISNSISDIPSDIEDTVAPLRVFISSMQDELASERMTVSKAVSKIEITRPWRFEACPSTSRPPENIYLSKAKECEIFILIIGSDVSEPVMKEHEAACHANRHRLYFVKRCDRTETARKFLDKLKETVTYCQFSNDNELRDAVIKSLWALLAESVRRENNFFGLAFADIAILLAMSEHMKFDKDEIVEDLSQIADNENDERRQYLRQDEISPSELDDNIDQTTQMVRCPREGRNRPCVEVTSISLSGHRAIFKSNLGITAIYGCTKCRVLFLDTPCPNCGRSPMIIKKALLFSEWRFTCSRCGNSYRYLPDSLCKMDLQKWSDIA